MNDRFIHTKSQFGVEFGQEELIIPHFFEDASSVTIMLCCSSFAMQRKLLCLFFNFAHNGVIFVYRSLLIFIKAHFELFSFRNVN